jgi:hypothetical protein
MPQLTSALAPDGMAVPVIVGLSHPSAATLTQAGQPLPNAVHVRALVDTGSDVTAIAPQVCRQLGLGPVRSSGTHTAGGRVTVNLDRVSLIVTGSMGLAGHTLA